MKVFAARPTKNTIPVSPVSKKELRAFLAGQPAIAKNWLTKTGFEADVGQIALVPKRDGTIARVVLGLGNSKTLWAFSHLPGSVPKGRYSIDGDLTDDMATAAALGWALGTYRYLEYKTEPRPVEAKLVWPDGCDRGEVTRLYEATALGRDLINRPAADLGPADIATQVRALGRSYKATVKVAAGAQLEKQYPAIHGVGKGAARGRGPRLCELSWGRTAHPKVTIVGKGVVFDSGGLDIKSAAGMRLMKKDMGGAASAIALAKLVMDAKLPVRLQLLIPTVENAVSAQAYRPGDVLKTRNGRTVEVGNTDAEGRLILCDALTRATESKPEIVIDFATLTGAARVALGTELPAMFCSKDRDAEAVREATAAHPADPDPLWHMPLFAPYRRHLRSYIADTNNIDNVGKGGAITAALFLQEFVGRDMPWIHIDTMAWNQGSRAGRPQGGELFGVRTIYRMLRQRYA